MNENQQVGAVKQSAPMFGFNRDQVELVKSVIAKDATDDELRLFLYTAQRTGLDPLTKQLHFVKRTVTKKVKSATGVWSEVKEGQMTIQTGIDGYRAIAERTGNLAGIDDAVFDTESMPHPDKATVTVYKMISGQRVAFTASARWNEYVQQYEKDEWVNGVKTGKKITVVGTMWQKMPYLMLAKCAEALALRKAFPNDLSGIYTNEEMTQADKHEQPEEKPQDKPSNEPPLPPEPPVEGELVYDDIQAAEEAPQPAQPRPTRTEPATGYTCLGCGKDVAQVVRDYSMKFYAGNTLCRDCQGQEKWLRIKTR